MHFKDYYNMFLRIFTDKFDMVKHHITNGILCIRIVSSDYIHVRILFKTSFLLNHLIILRLNLSFCKFVFVKFAAALISRRR